VACDTQNTVARTYTMLSYTLFSRIMDLKFCEISNNERFMNEVRHVEGGGLADLDRKNFFCLKLLMFVP
jgi:hypothetical protein